MTEADSIACDHSAAFAPDRVVRLVATDGYQIHRLIYEALAKDGVRDFLFAPFPLPVACMLSSCALRREDELRRGATLSHDPVRDALGEDGRQAAEHRGRTVQGLAPLALDSCAGARQRLHAPVGARDAGGARPHGGRRVDYERYLEFKVGGVKGSSDEGRVDLRERKAFLSGASAPTS